MTYAEETKEILKKWGIIKNQKHLQLYYDIAPMNFADKILDYGELFKEDFIYLIQLKDEKAIIRFIKRARSKRNQLLIADTFLAMRKGFQSIMDDCEHRLLKLCTLKNEDCNPMICPKIKDLNPF